MVSNAKPKLSREETKDHLNTLIYGPHHSLDGPILVSDIPPPAKAKKGVTVGIDEAGRGPVLGPMVYALAYWNDDASFPLAGYNDSKQMSVEMRNRLFESTINETNIGFVLRVLHASEISGNMLRQDTYNLNTMSHDAAIQMIRCLLDSGVVISKCFIDTVGRESTYKKLLDTVFDGEGIEFVVEKKADANYVHCSAASILAKVTRDLILENWSFTEPNFPLDRDYGSGYPSDPKCKEWISRKFEDPLFGYPNLVRFSWGPVKDIMKEKGVKVEWEADEEDEQHGAMLAFVRTKNSPLPSQSRFEYFETRKLKRITKFCR